jgi:hypothetical protein
MEESLSHSMGYTPGIFDNIFRWHFVLEIDISMIFRGHMHIIIIVTLKNLILKYIGMENINIWKRMCQVGINVVFLEVILKLYDVCFMKNIFIGS